MGKPLMPSIVKLAVSPILFYQERVAGPPRWASPVAALVCCGALAAMAQVLAATRAWGDFRTDVGALLSVLMIGTFAFLFVLQTGAVVCLERLFSSARNGRRLVECSALAYWTQVPLAAFGVGFWALMESGEPPVLPANAGFWTVMAASSQAVAAQQSLPAVLLFEDLATCYSLWVVALQAAALRAVSKFSVGGAAAAGCLLGLLFVALPWAFPRFVF